jgi:hypothetical protein
LALSSRAENAGGLMIGSSKTLVANNAFHIANNASKSPGSVSTTRGWPNPLGGVSNHAHKNDYRLERFVAKNSRSKTFASGSCAEA